MADRIQALCAEPAFRSLPPDGLEAARDAWQTQRTYERETQARERAPAENAARTSRWVELERRRPIAPFPVHGRERGGPGIGF